MSASPSESPYPALRNETFYPGRHNTDFELDERKKRLVTIEFLGFVEGWALKREIDYAIYL
jgi:hypothetical protein